MSRNAGSSSSGATDSDDGMRSDRHGPATGDLAKGIALRRTLDDMYMERPEDAILREALDDMVEVTLSGSEGRAVIVAGTSGAGKTTLVERVTAGDPELAIDGTGTQAPGMIAVQVPGSCGVADLGALIARRAGYPVRDGLNASIAWGAARNQLKMRGIRFIFLDEVGNLADTLNVREARKVRNELKMALVDKDHHVSFVLSGVTAAIGFLLGDKQVMRRCDVVEIPPVHGSMHGAIAAAMIDLAGTAGLPLREDAAAAIVPRLVHGALGAFGSCIELTKSTVVKAVRRSHGKGSPALTMNDFAHAWARKYGVAATENPFVASDWERLDCAAIVSRNGIRASDTPVVESGRTPVRGKAR